MKRGWLALVVVLVTACLTWSASARAEPVRILVAAGHTEGLFGELPLHHANDDARRVRDVFTQLGGVKPENAILLEQPTVASFEGALARAKSIADRHRPDEVTLLVYFSGHGDHEAIHLGQDALPLADVAARIGAVPAGLKLVVFDACRTVRVKGLSTEPAFAISLVPPPSASGVVWLHASADGEAAQESDDLDGAVFTHFWISGLRGAADTNGDHRVTLSESYDFAYQQTLYRSARSAGTLQRPAASSALKETSPVVLTQTLATTTLLRFPRSADAYYLVFATGSHTVAGEVWGEPERVAQIALAPGRYVVQRRVSGGNGATVVSLGQGEQRDLSSSDFRPFEAEALAQKGGELEVFPWEASLAYGAGTGGLFAFGQAIDARLAYRFGTWALSLGVEGGLGRQTVPTATEDLVWGGGDVAIEQRVRLGAFELRLAAGPAVRYLVQHVHRDDAARLGLAGYTANETHHAWAWGGDAVVGLALALSPRVAVALDARGALLAAKTDSAARPYAEVGGLLGARYAF